MNSNDTGKSDSGFDLDEILAEVKAFNKASDEADPSFRSKSWTSQDVDRLINAAGLPSENSDTDAEQTDYSIYLEYDLKPHIKDVPKTEEDIVHDEPSFTAVESKQPYYESPVTSNILEMPPVGSFPDKKPDHEPLPVEIVIDPEEDSTPEESAQNKVVAINILKSVSSADFDNDVIPLQTNDYLRGMETDEARERFLNILELEKTAEHDVFGVNDPIEKPGVILDKNRFSKTSDLEPMPMVFPAEDVLRAAIAEGKTIISGAAPLPNNTPEESTGIMDGQIVLTGYKNEELKTESVSEAAVETALYARRKEKAKNFTLAGIPEEGDIPYQSDADFDSFDGGTDSGKEKDASLLSTDQKLEYRFPEQRNRIYASIKTACSRSTLSSVILSIIVLAFLVVLALPILLNAASVDSALFAASGKAYLFLSILLLSIAALSNMPCIISGYKSIFRLKPNCDTSVALAVTFAAVQNISLFFVLPPQGNAYAVYSAAAVFGLLLNSFGRRFNHAGALGNFEFCAYKSPQNLFSIKDVEDSAEAFEIGRGILMGNPAIAYSCKTEFPSDFIENAKSVGLAEQYSTYQVPVTAGLSLIISIIAGFVSNSVMLGFTVFTGAMCLSVPACAFLVSTFSLRAANKKLNDANAMISNWTAAEECAKSNAVVIDSADLFDRSLCEMHGMKEFKNFRIDDVILYTAAMIIKSGGPLTDIFDKVIVCNRELLPPVKSLSYEDRLGLTAWIHGQKVFLGNRNMLVHHNIDVPPKGDEDKYKHDGRKVMYLAIANKIAAMFVVSYCADSSLFPYIKNLERNGIQLLVRTCDSNITEDLLADCFSLPVNNVKVISSIAGRLFKRYKDKVTETAPAKVLHDGSALSLLKSIATASSLSFGIRVAQIIQSVGIGVGLVGLLVMVFLSKTAFASSLTVILFQAFFAAVSLAAGYLKRVK